MIKVTVWNENVQENGLKFAPLDLSDPAVQPFRAFLERSEREIRLVHPTGIHGTLAKLFGEEADMQVRTVTMDMPECGLTQEVLDDTDVLVWWAHIAHDRVPDEIAMRVKQAVLKGMGFIALHSAHQCKPLQMLLGTSGALKWREDDRARVWCTCPTHPIAAGIRNRSSCRRRRCTASSSTSPSRTIWCSSAGTPAARCSAPAARGRAATARSSTSSPVTRRSAATSCPEVRRILKNAVRWAAPAMRIAEISCPHAEVSAEAKYRAQQK